MRTRLPLSAAVLLAAAVPAHAQPQPSGDFSLTLGFGAAAFSAYQGSNTVRGLPLPYIDLNWADTVFISGQDLLRIDALRVASIETPGIAFGPVARFRFGRQESFDRTALNGLGNIPAVIEAGLFASAELGQGFSVRLTGAQALNGNAGFAAELGLNYATNFGPLFLAGGIGVQAVDAQYNQTYFGITPSRAAASGRPAYNPGGGLQRAGVDLVASFPLTERLGITGVGAYQRLLGDAADSPIVRGPGGSPNILFGGLFLTWKLY